MILFFAGSEGEYFEEILLDVGVRARLKSAYFLKYKKPCNPKLTEFFLLDSGGFSARMQNKKIDVKDYANYINKEKVTLCFNLDPMDVEEHLINQAYLEEHTNAYIIPIYHYSSWKNPKYKYLLDEYIEKYPYISIGGISGILKKKAEYTAFYNYIFKRTRDKVKVHGLGVTAQRIMMDYPFYSVDSTTWLNACKYGEVLHFRNGGFVRLPSAKSASRQKDKRLKHIDILRDKKWKLRQNAVAFKQMEKYITDLWIERGVVWDNKEAVQTELLTENSVDCQKATGSSAETSQTT